MFYNPILQCPRCKKERNERDFIQDDCGCGFRLRIIFDYENLKERVTQEILKKRPFGHLRYAEFFPINNPVKNLIDLGTGGTPLIRSKKLADKIGIRKLFLKLEIGNPSGSFKDRPISIGVSKAKEFNSQTLTAASSGNAAAALATFGARAGHNVVVFVPEHSPQGKIAQLSYLGAKVIRVSIEKEGEDPTVKLFQLAYKKYGWTPCPSFGPFNPFQFFGTKSLGFELCEQLDSVPDWILCNTGSGGLLAGTYEGFKDFKQLDFIENTPQMVAVQPQECAPIVQAVLDKIQPLEFKDWPKTPNTIAGGLADPHPWDADSALEAIYESNGTAIAVDEKSILETQRWLATYEGIFGEPSGTAAIAGLIQLVNLGTIDPSDCIVVPITGIGFKDPEVVLKSIQISKSIKPELSELEKLLKSN
jgi:threonine synthase